MNFGWTAPFGVFGAGGGVKRPALINSILQWLTKYVGGSIPFDDKVDPRLDSPELTGVSVFAPNNPAGPQGIDTNLFPFVGTKPFTLSCWFDCSVAQISSWASQWGANPAFRAHYLWRRVGTGDLQLVAYDTSGSQYVDSVSTDDVPASGWHHVEMSKAGASTIWKIDGVVVPSSGDVPANLGMTGVPSLLIGARWNDYGSIPWYSGGLKSMCNFVYELDGVVIADFPLQESEGYLCYNRVGGQPAMLSSRADGANADTSFIPQTTTNVIPSVNTLDGFGTTTVGKYDLFLQEMDSASPTIINRIFQTTETFSAPYAAHRASLVSLGWTITDGGEA